MDDIHLSREILRAVETGVLSRRVLDEIKTEHLLSRCPHCRAEAEAFEAERRAKGSVLHQIFQIVSLLLERLTAVSSREAARARRDLRELLPLSRDERLKKVDRARARFCSPNLVHLVLAESQQHIPGEPDEAFALAELARRIANRNPRMPAYFDVYVLATAAMANARRAGGDLQGASQLFVLVRQVIAEHGVTDPAVVARVDDLLGSLRKDQRRLGEAEKLLKRAVMQFRLIQSQADAARGLVNLGAVHYHQKKLDAAIETTRSALALLSAESDPRLHLCGTYNLAFYLTGAGRFEEAAELLEWNEGLFRRFPEPWTQLRLLWLQGDIAAGLGDLAAAERAYGEARDGFVAQGIGYDAAMVSLDLAVLYLRQGRTGDVRRIAEEMIPLFQAQDVHREALAAFALFQEAARQDRLTVEKALEVAACLREARHEPDRRFASEASEAP